MKKEGGGLPKTALWWTGWHPVLAASVFSVGGVLLSNLLGWFGVGTTLFGFVAVAVGVFVPSVRKMGVVAALVAVVVFFGVGTEVIVEIASSFGIEASRLAEEVSALVVLEPTSNPAMVVAESVANLALTSLAGASFGVAVWLPCALYVNVSHERLLEQLIGRVREAGEGVLDGEGSLHTLTNGKGAVPLVKPAKEYDVANVLVGESSVGVHHGSFIDTVSRTVEVGDGTEDVYYDQISSVGYDGRRLRIRTADGGSVNVVTSDEATEIVDEIEERLREYKAKSAVDGAEGQEETPASTERRNRDEGTEETEQNDEGEVSEGGDMDDTFEDTEDIEEVLSGNGDDTDDQENGDETR